MNYDSKFERRLAEGPLRDFEYHPKEKVEYLKPAENKKYEPDFKKGYFLIESKGRFRTRDEAYKYKHINTSLKDSNYKLIFVLEQRNKPMPGASKRKDGTKQTHEEFLDKLEIEYYYEDEIHKLIERVEK